jgi:putative DNA primase/helicase
VSPLWDRVLAEWQPAAPIREFLEEWIGYGLEDGYPYQYSAVNVGDGDNGKGVFLAIMGALFSGAISAETLTTLNSRFGPANLYGALVNLADELPAGEITDSAKFKAVTGGSLIRAERKGEDPFTFVNRAKMTFATNLLPKVSDRSRAFWRRVIPIRWDYIVPAETKDVHLEEKLRAELPGILNRAIAGLKRLRERGGFAAVPTVAEAAEAWRRSSDSLAYFADQMLERDPKEMVPKSALMMAYRLFCEDRELDAGKESQVGSRLPDLLPGVHAARPRIGDRQVAVWKGVRLLEAPKDASTGGFERGEQGEQGGYSSHGVEKLEGGGVGTPLTHPAQPAQAAPTPLIHPRAPSAWPPPPGTPRPIHDGCDLCPTIPAHVCPACKACLAAGATW